MEENKLFDETEEKKDFNVFKAKVNNDVKISVCGIGGAGGNTVNRLIEELKKEAGDIKFIAVNTDNQALSRSKTKNKVQIGKELLKGKGAGNDPEMGMRAMEENLGEVLSILKDSDIIFFAAGLGKGTGTGATPYVVEKIRNEFIETLVICVVTTPFFYEGKRKIKLAEKTIENLKKNSDAVIVISNQKLSENFPGLPSEEAFKKSDELLSSAIKGLINIIKYNGNINVDFNDVRFVLKDSGNAVMGIGVGQGEDRARKALEKAIHNNLLWEEIKLSDAKKAIIFVTGKSVTVGELTELGEELSKKLHEDADIITGVYSGGFQDDDRFEVIVYIGGFESKDRKEKLELESTMVKDTAVKNVTTVNGVESEGLIGGFENSNDYDKPAYLRRRKRDNIN